MEQNDEKKEFKLVWDTPKIVELDVSQDTESGGGGTLDTLTSGS